MGTWQVVCRACDYAWRLAGNWSEYERQAVESRPCPCCGSYTLTSPEPKPQRGRRTRAVAKAG